MGVDNVQRQGIDLQRWKSILPTHGRSGSQRSKGKISQFP